MRFGEKNVSAEELRILEEYVKGGGAEVSDRVRSFEKDGLSDFDFLNKEMIMYAVLNDIMENLSEIQRKITQLKISGYSNKETYLIVGMQPSSYYKEMKRIRAIVENILNI